MAYHCIKGIRGECDGCGECEDRREYICPVCGEVVYETVYKTVDGDVFGCENCVEICSPEVLLDED